MSKKKTVEAHLGDAIESLGKAKKQAFKDMQDQLDREDTMEMKESLKMIESFDDIIGDIEVWQ
jgi:hypothetical protein